MKIISIVKLCLIAVVLLTILTGISFAAEPLMMATTTSTDNTGLLEYLMPFFTEDTGIDIKWTATGTGKALKLGENCDVDILMVHAPASEKQYVADGFGIDRREIMYNDFVLIGPVIDTAGIQGKSVAEALQAIHAKETVFVSRGDNSGTHKKEQSLWEGSGMPLPEKETWYVQTGQGMLTTINIAAEREGYTMTDRGTYIKYEADKQGNPPLKILVEGDQNLLNQYSVITVNPERCKSVKADLATAFSDWVAGEKAQSLIRDFKLMGKQLFTPNAN